MAELGMGAGARRESAGARGVYGGPGGWGDGSRYLAVEMSGT